MKNRYIFLHSFITIVVIGFMFYLSSVQWRGNQETRIEGMKPTVELTVGDRIYAMTFSPFDSNIIVTAGKSNKAKIWNIHSDENPIQIFATESETPEEKMWSVDCLAYSKSGEWVLTKTFTRLVFWHIATNREISIDSIRSFTAEASPFEDILAVGLHDIRLWDFSDPNALKPLYVLPPKIGDQHLTHEEAELIPHQNVVINQSYKNIAFSYDGKWIAASGRMYDKSRSRHIDKVKVWDLRSKKLIKEIERPFPTDLKENVYRRDIESIRFSPDNRFFAITGNAGITIWSITDWKVYKEILDKEITNITFSPNGSLYAISGRRKITLLKLDNDIPIAVLKDNTFLSIYDLIVFSPDGKTLAKTQFDGYLTIWNIEKNK